jgi:hypothetical protein
VDVRFGSISGHDRLHEKASALPLKADIRLRGRRPHGSPPLNCEPQPSKTEGEVEKILASAWRPAGEFRVMNDEIRSGVGAPPARMDYLARQRRVYTDT